MTIAGRNNEAGGGMKDRRRKVRVEWESTHNAWIPSLYTQEGGMLSRLACQYASRSTHVIIVCLLCICVCVCVLYKYLCAAATRSTLSYLANDSSAAQGMRLAGVPAAAASGQDGMLKGGQHD